MTIDLWRLPWHACWLVLAGVAGFSVNGDVLGRWNVPTDRGVPFRYVCGLDGRFVFHPFGAFPSEPGFSRWRVPVVWTDRQGVLHVLREDVPGPERVLSADSYEARHWGRELVVAAASTGVWLGSSDAYALDMIGWDGNTGSGNLWVGPWIEHDWVLVVRRDELGIERVAVYETK